MLAYGGNFIYAPKEFAPPVGKGRFEVGLYFFSGSIEDAMVVQRAEEFAQPIVVLPSTPKSPFKSEEFSLVKIELESAAVISAVYRSDEGLVISLWRPYEGRAKFKVSVDGAKSLWLADLRGKPQKQLVKGNAIGFQRGQAESSHCWLKKSSPMLSRVRIKAIHCRTKISRVRELLAVFVSDGTGMTSALNSWRPTVLNRTAVLPRQFSPGFKRLIRVEKT